MHQVRSVWSFHFQFPPGLPSFNGLGPERLVLGVIVVAAILYVDRRRRRRRDLQA